MKTELKAIPSHYRQLKSDETIRRGDIFLGKESQLIRRCLYSIGDKVSQYDLFTFYRRKHVKVGVPPMVAFNIGHAIDVKKQEYPSKSPLVTFYYPSRENHLTFTRRSVRLIAADAKYVIGLDVNDKFKFKKFLRKKASMIEVVEFNVNALK
jgi:hypothetical protein